MNTHNTDSHFNPCQFVCISRLNSSMRITGGHAARRILKVPKGLDVRPTPDLVKQAVFNSLGARVVDARVLELFAGSGALSLECLSRGAASRAVRREIAPRTRNSSAAMPARRATEKFWKCARRMFFRR